LIEREALMDLAMALSWGGSGDDARTTLRTLDTLEVSPTFLTGVDLVMTRGWVAAANGDLKLACNYLDHAIEIGMDIGDLVGVTTAIHGLARLGYGTTDTARQLVELANQVEGRLVIIQALHVQHLLDNESTGLDAVAEQFYELGAHIFAAEAALDAAAAWRDAGQQRNGAASELRAATIISRCTGAVLVGRRAGATRIVLTPAEREAALLAAAGRTNRSIADQLQLSVRTIEGRLQSVYVKLGVSSREELGTWMRGAESE
jgi:DNA-binding CsgD family transcriptional regulator